MDSKKITARLAFAAVGILLFSSAAQAAQPQDRFIVVLKDGAGMPEDVARDVALRTSGKVGYVYRNALKGFSVTIPHTALAGLVQDARIAYVEEDKPVTIFAQTIPTGVERIFASQSVLDIDGTDDYRVDVDVAVIDTGVDFEHPDLNVVGGLDCTVSSGVGPPWSRTYYCSETEGTGGDDDHYHGTHVAGTIGAIDNGIGVVGVAPGARIHAVKVLDSGGSGYESGIIAGIDWVAANAGTIEVANMSLGSSGYSQAEYDAIQGAVDAGVAFAVSAGNSDADAGNYSPAAFDNVLTVSALADFDGEAGGLGSPTCQSDQDDTLADFSNWGDAVQIAAPGVCILSTYPIEQGEYGTISGTSMSSPHVAGALALLASNGNPSDAADVYDLYDRVINAGNTDWTDDSGDGTVEPLLDVSDDDVFTPVLVATGGGGPTDDPPSVSVTDPVDGATVSGTVSVTASASDDNGVDQVEFFVDGVSIGVDSVGSDGWSASWDTTAYADGSDLAIGAEATDSIGQTAFDSITATVDNSGGGPGDDLTLEVDAYKLRGAQYADLAWSGAMSATVDVYRDGSVVETTENDGAFTDVTGQKGGGSSIYRICEAETDTCSNDVTAIW